MKKKTLFTPFILLSLVFSLCVFTGCGGGGGSDTPVTPAASTGATISGTAEVPNDVQLARTSKNLFQFVKSLFFNEAEAVTSKKPLSGAAVTMNVLNKEGTLVAVSTIPAAATDEKGNFKITDVPEGDNYVVEVKLTTPQGKTVKVYDIVSVESKDIGQTKSSSCNVEGNLTVAAAVDVAKSTGKDLKDIDRIQIEEIKTTTTTTLATDETTTKLVNLVTVATSDLTTIKQELDKLKQSYQDLSNKIDDLLSKGTIAGEVKDSSGNVLAGATISVSGGALTGEATTTTNSSGQYVARVPGSSAAYTVKVSLSGYQDSTKEGVFATASSVTVVNFTLSAASTVTPPSSPSSVQAKTGDGKVTLSWNAVSGATSYNLYMAAQSGVTKSNYSLKTGGMKHEAVTSPYEHTGLTNGATYYFVVTAVNSNGESSESSEVSAAPNAETNQSPSVSITTPSENATYTQGQPVSFSGTATDPEDGALSGTSLVWTESTTKLATGSSFSKSDFSSGTHIVTLTATDSKGTTGSASLTINVVPAQATLSSISISVSGTTITAGGTRQVSATGTYSDGKTANITTLVTWASSSTSVGTINSSGVFSALAEGKTTITATKGNVTSNSLTLEVTNKGNVTVTW